MPRGGRRAGAGRKPSLATRRTREAANLAQLADDSPMQIMLKLMRAYWAEAFSVDEKGKPVMDEAKAREAGAWAVAVAPYVHPKLASVEPRPEVAVPTTDGLSDLEKARRVAFAMVRGIMEQSKLKKLPAKVKT